MAVTLGSSVQQQQLLLLAAARRIWASGSTQDRARLAAAQQLLTHSSRPVAGHYSCSVSAVSFNVFAQLGSSWKLHLGDGSFDLVTSLQEASGCFSVQEGPGEPAVQQLVLHPRALLAAVRAKVARAPAKQDNIAPTPTAAGNASSNGNSSIEVDAMGSNTSGDTSLNATSTMNSSSSSRGSDAMHGSIDHSYKHVCSAFSKTGYCKYGQNCWFSHPGEAAVASAAVHRSTDAEAELPVRLHKKDCPHYMKTGHCRHCQDCWFNHPPGVHSATRVTSPSSGTGDSCKTATTSSMPALQRTLHAAADSTAGAAALLAAARARWGSGSAAGRVLLAVSEALIHQPGGRFGRLSCDLDSLGVRLHGLHMGTAWRTRQQLPRLKPLLQGDGCFCITQVPGGCADHCQVTLDEQRLLGVRAANPPAAVAHCAQLGSSVDAASTPATPARVARGLLGRAIAAIAVDAAPGAAHTTERVDVKQGPSLGRVWRCRGGSGAEEQVAQPEAPGHMGSPPRDGPAALIHSHSTGSSSLSIKISGSEASSDLSSGDHGGTLITSDSSGSLSDSSSSSTGNISGSSSNRACHISAGSSNSSSKSDLAMTTLASPAPAALSTPVQLDLPAVRNSRLQLWLQHKAHSAPQVSPTSVLDTALSSNTAASAPSLPDTVDSGATGTAKVSMDSGMHKDGSASTADVEQLAAAVAALLAAQPTVDVGAFRRLAGNVGNRLNAVGRGPAWRQQQGLLGVMEGAGSSAAAARAEQRSWQHGVMGSVTVDMV